MGECRIITLRKRTGLTIDDFCKKAGISRQTYWNAAKKDMLTRKTIDKICTAFGCNEWWVSDNKRTEQAKVQMVGEGVIVINLGPGEIEDVKTLCFNRDVTKTQLFEDIIREGLAQLN